jgi:hypothetical protein
LPKRQCGSGYAGGEGKRGAIVGELATDQQQIDLAHELVTQPEGERFLVHLRQRGEGHVAGGADQCVERTCSFEQFADRCAVTNIDMLVTAVTADANDVMARRQFPLDRRTDGSASANQ